MVAPNEQSKPAHLSITFNSGITAVIALVEVVTVTKKGQATIPKRLRKKYGIKDKVLIEDTDKGIILKPLPSPNDDLGSLKPFFKGKTARELLEESRKDELTKEKEWATRARTSNL